MKKIQFLLLFACIVFSFSTDQVLAAPAEIVAQSRENVADDPYQRFRRFILDNAGLDMPVPIINNNGDTLFYAALGGSVGISDKGIWVDSVSTGRRTVAIRYEAIPGYSPAVSFQSFSKHVLTEGGDAVFRASLTGPGALSGNQGFWRSTPTSLLELERAGSPAPQTNPQLYFRTHDDLDSFNVAFISRTPTSEVIGIPVDVSNNPDSVIRFSGVWMPQIANPLRILEGYPAPGISNTTISTLGLSPRNDGPVVYRGTLSGPGVQTLTFGGATVVNDVALWSDVGGVAPTLIARKGQLMNTGSPGQILSSLYGATDRYSFGAENGSVLFAGTIINQTTGTNMGDGLWRTNNGSFEQIFRTGQAITNAPGLTADLIISHATKPTILDCDGQAVFLGSVAGAGITYQNALSLFQQTPTGPMIIARARQQAPGLPEGGIFSQTGLTNGKIVCGGDGRLAFSSLVQGTGVNSANDKGIWYAENGQPQLALREGMQVGNFDVTEIVDAGADLQMTDDGRLIVSVLLKQTGNPFSASYTSVLAWSPCGGVSILVSTGQPLELEGGINTGIVTYRIGSENVINDNGDTVLAVALSNGIPEDEAVVKIPFPTCSSGCAADFDGNGTAEVSDIFAFLSAWFAGNLDADANDNGSLAVDDIFAFLSSWFAGC